MQRRWGTSTSPPIGRASRGVTVYREGSRQGILQTADSQKEKQPPQKEDTPAAEAPSASKRSERGYHPRRRPAVTTGVTERIRTGEGNIYVTINEDDQGLCEVFSTIGKAGGNAAAQSEAISRLISIALRSGIDPQEIVKSLKGISGPTPVWEDGELILSAPDAIGRALERFLQRGVEPGAESAGSDPDSREAKSSATCPECGSTVVHESNCLNCKHCGWSKC